MAAVEIERVGSFEKHGDYRRVQLAVNGCLCAPLWLSEPEFRSYEANGILLSKLAQLSLLYDEEARRLQQQALNHLTQEVRR